MTPVRGVLFDFSGTLFHLEPEPSPGSDLLTIMASPAYDPAGLAPDLVDAWQRRDLDPAAHRKTHLQLLATAGITDPEPVYELMRADQSWIRYPDTLEALRRVREHGLPVAVVSNIAWDIRAAFQLGGVYDLVDTFVLSYVEGVQKPDPLIFELACDRIGVRPAEALMVGDSPADAAAAELGAAVEMVSNVPSTDRPDALITALGRHGIG